MKKQTTILFSVTATLLIAQQYNLKGIVTYHNSKYETGKTIPVRNATLEEAFEGKFSSLTNSDGTFNMAIIGIEEGKPLWLNVYKKEEDLEVVNADRLQTIVGQKELVKFYMASRKKLADARKEFYQIGKTKAEKILLAKYNKAHSELITLQKNAKENEVRIIELEAEISSLVIDSKRIEENSKDLADRYSKINLDNASVLYLEAFYQFQIGNLQEALEILQKADLITQAKKMLKKEEIAYRKLKEANEDLIDVKEKKPELKEALHFKADLQKSELQWDSVELTYRFLILLDSSDIENLLDYSTFLDRQNQNEKAILYYEKCLKLVKNEKQEAFILGQLGNIYKNQNNMVEAEIFLLHSLEICEQYIKDKPDLEENLAWVTMNLGSFYHLLNKTKEAEKMYIRSLEIYEKLAKIHPTKFERFLSISLMNFASFYLDSQKPKETERMYLRALEIQEKLVNKQNIEYEADLALTLSHLGDFYFKSQKMTEAENYYQRSLDLYEQLVTNNPIRFEPYMANLGLSIGSLYATVKNIPKAEKMFLLAFKTQEQLVINDPSHYEPDFAFTAMDFGVFYQINNMLPEAEKMYLLSLNIYERLAKNNPSQFEPDLAKVVMNLGGLYQILKRMYESEKMYLRSLIIHEQLAKNHPPQFEPDLAFLLLNLGGFYQTIEKWPEAEMMYVRSLEIYERIVKVDPYRYDSDFAIALSEFGYYWLRNQQFTNAKPYLSRALALYQKALLNGQKYQIDNFNQTYIDMASLRDSFFLQKEFTTAALIQLERTACIDSLKIVDSSFQLKISFEYDTLTRLYLFANNLKAAEIAVKRGIELNPTLTKMYLNLATVYLLQGKEIEAKLLYQTNLNIKSSNDVKYRDDLFKLIESLQALGVANKNDLVRVKNWLK